MSDNPDMQPWPRDQDDGPYREQLLRTTLRALDLYLRELLAAQPPDPIKINLTILWSPGKFHHVNIELSQPRDDFLTAFRHFINTRPQ
jgi:hypothetical protein